MFALNNSGAFVKIINASSGKFQKINSNKNVRATVISPILTSSPFSIPDSPEYVSVERINKMNSIYHLKKLEHEYDEFLEKKCQILLLLNVIDEVFEIRDTLIMRVNYLRRKERQCKMRFENIDFKI
jgi:hypothetical protein